MRSSPIAREPADGRAEACPSAIEARDDAELEAIALLCWLLAWSADEPERPLPGVIAR
jgi:hypothetical protein